MIYQWFFRIGQIKSDLYNQFSQIPYFNSIILFAFLFTVILQPTSVLIKKSFSFLFRNRQAVAGPAISSELTAGKIIGMLERIITAILLIVGQYAAIGLVLTAKSIARFKNLEERDFAERYLTGTLISLTITLIATMAVMLFT